MGVRSRCKRGAWARVAWATGGTRLEATHVKDNTQSKSSISSKETTPARHLDPDREWGFSFRFSVLIASGAVHKRERGGGDFTPPRPPRVSLLHAHARSKTPTPSPFPSEISHTHAFPPTPFPPDNLVCRPLFPQRRGAWGFQGQRTGGGRGGGEQLRRARHRGWSCGDLPGAHAHLAALAAEAAHALLAPLGAHAALS